MLKTQLFYLAHIPERLKVRRILLWFSAMLLTPAALIISQNQASPSFNKSWLSYLVQTSVKVSLWSVHSHCLTLGEKILFLLACSSCVPRDRSRTKDFCVHLFFQPCCHLMAPKPMERSWAVRWGWGGGASLQGAGILAPWPGTSSIQGHRGVIRMSQHQVQGRAIQVVSVSSSPELNLCWIGVELIHKASLSNRQWDFWPVKNFPHSPLCEGLGLHFSGITYLCRSEIQAQFGPETQLQLRLAVSATLTS